MNIVVDTNVLISAVLWKGPPSDALKIILEKYSLVQSRSTLKEFENVIRREKFTRILEKRDLTVETVIETLITQSRLYNVSKKAESTAREVKIEDVDDLIFVELALETGAKFVVSGDKHLLQLDEVGNSRILSVAAFLRLGHEEEIVPDTV
ncbi:MAG: putative toxin-antitoxin system toxin component, PIN family [Desulfobacterales bacterium C00003104]|jgi:putative PIN family toxin of toxin-antitoxin system|nr:MAG: putative toxin-antitoxin system toxin component, PIN family [Desulfobacterales bacterium C00003104]